jgi:hypothetical protein
MAVGVGSCPFTSVFYLHEECVELYITAPSTLHLSKHAAFTWLSKIILQKSLCAAVTLKVKIFIKTAKVIGYLHNIEI